MPTVKGKIAHCRVVQPFREGQRLKTVLEINDDNHDVSRNYDITIQDQAVPLEFGMEIEAEMDAPQAYAFNGRSGLTWNVLKYRILD